MQLEAHADAFIRDINAFVEAHVLAIDRYLSGHLDRNEERPLAALAPGPNAPEPGPAGIRFEGKQAVLRLAERRAGLAMQATAAGDEGAWERLRADAGKPGHRPIVCSGRPGTGKTTVLHRNVRETLAAGGSVLVTIPTARQSTRMAAKLGAHDRLVVETAAAAFQFHKPEQEALYAIYLDEFSVVVDEFSAGPGAVRAHLAPVARGRSAAGPGVCRRQVSVAGNGRAPSLGEPGLECQGPVLH